MNYLLGILLLWLIHGSYASSVVNVYVWGGEIPKQIIQQFEHHTKIKVNFSTYDSNETLLAKLKANNSSMYDVILPSAYYLQRMRDQKMLTQLDHRKLTNYRHLAKRFKNNDYDPNNQYSIPLIWGSSGLFVNKSQLRRLSSWQELWQPQWKNRLMLLDDFREVFAAALMSLGFNPNDDNLNHIQMAYERLLQLIPNIKLFASDNVQAILIDEEAMAGMAWNADVVKAHKENKAIEFIYPEEGFIIWVDCLAIPINAPHKKEAYAFINYLLKPQIAADIALIEGHALTNAKAYALLPKAVQSNPLIYPDKTVLKRGFIQKALKPETLEKYQQYWQQLKLAF